jgi:uncharacterized protein (TIGR01777 family)
MDVVVSGASGLIGSAVRASLAADGHRVAPLVRGSAADGIGWDPARGTIDSAGLEGINAVVHLAGQPIAAGPWTRSQRGAILRSRVDGTALLARALAGLANPPKVLVSGSAIGVYGNVRPEPLDETSPPGQGFLAEVCRQWEGATAPAEAAGIRVAHLRTGMVVSPTGGALAPFRLAYRLGIGLKLGARGQYLSWIHLDDEVGAIRHIIDTASVRGPVNATAPHPELKDVFSAEFAARTHRRAWLRLPRLVTKAPFGIGPLVDSLLFDSVRVLPTVLESSEYEFRFPMLGPALADVAKSW